MGKILLQGSTIIRKIFESLTDEQAETGFFIINPLTMLGNSKNELSGNDGIKRRVRHEIKKDFFEYIEANEFDYIALDLFTAAQLDSYKYDDNYYSASQAFIESDFFLMHKDQLVKTSELKEEENWRPLLKDFAEKLLQVFDRDHIILYRTNIHTRGVLGKKLTPSPEKSELNKRLKAMEDYFVELTDACTIDICNDYFINLDKKTTEFEPLFYTDALNAFRYVIQGSKRNINSGNSYFTAKRIVRYYDSIVGDSRFDWIAPNNLPIRDIIQNTSKLFVAEHQDIISILISQRFANLDMVALQYEKNESMADFIEVIRQILEKNKPVVHESDVEKANIGKKQIFKPNYAGIDTINVIKSVSQKEMDNYIDKAYEKKKKRLKVPGFRNGNIPKDIALKYYGSGYFFDEASKICIKETEPQTVTTSGELIISKPESKVVEIIDKKGFKYQTTAKMHEGFHDLKNNTVQFIRQNVSAIDTLSEKTKFIVFFSISNMDERASVFYGTGSSPEQAVTTAAIKLARNYKGKVTKNTVIKADIVSSILEMRTVDLTQFMRRVTFEKFFRYGLSFDKDFKEALLEEEMNAYQIYDYKNWTIAFDRVKKYRGLHNQETIDSIPEKIYLFETQSLFVDTNGKIEVLYGGSGLNKGRRKLGVVDDRVCEALIRDTMKYLKNQIREDGSFVYGYYPSFDKELKSYNILRHLGTTWSMMCADDILEDSSVQQNIEKVLTHALEHYMEEKDGDTAYIIERKANEIKLGGNGIAVIALTKYMENYGGNQYLDAVRKLANGMVLMQDSETGRYNHVLNYPDYSLKEAMRTVYYDGESTYALVLAFEHTGDSKYLECAKKALDYQIANNYIRYRDHWLAYAFNAYIKHDMSEKYVDFALRNAKDNLKTIRNQQTSYHTYEELLTMTLDTYLFVKEKGYSSDYFINYNIDELKEVIRHRAWHMLDGYWYPEYAMYMACPKRVLGSFFVRHDGFRSRIDDDQHFVDGYVKYAKLYQDIKLS